MAPRSGRECDLTAGLGGGELVPIVSKPSSNDCDSNDQIIPKLRERERLTVTETGDYHDTTTSFGRRSSSMRPLHLTLPIRCWKRQEKRISDSNKLIESTSKSPTTTKRRRTSIMIQQ